MVDFVQTLVTALAIGSLYALIALGYTMVYGILRFINFAHSDIVVLGAWISYTLATRILARIGFDPHQSQLTPPIWVAAVILVAAMACCGLAGFLIERLAYRPLRRAPRLNVLIAAIGVSLLLQNIGQLGFVFGASPQRMPTLLSDRELLRWTVGGGNEGGQSRSNDAEQSAERARDTSSPLPDKAKPADDSSATDGASQSSRRAVVIGLIDTAIFGTSAGLLLLLEWLIYHTKLGTAMRAVAESAEIASLMGVPVDRVISFTFMLGSALAAAAGFLYAMKYPSLQSPANLVWVLLGLKAFVAAVVGGIGNVRGAVAGGFIIAFVEQFAAYYISSSYRDVYVFALLIIILLVRPTGLFGSSAGEKV